MIQQALKLVGKKKLEWVTTRVPALEADQALIETIATAISVGAELPQFYEKELHTVGSSDGWDYREHFKWYFEASWQTSYIQEIFELDIDQYSLIATFERLSAHVINPIKIAVTYKKENTSFAN